MSNSRKPENKAPKLQSYPFKSVGKYAKEFSPPKVKTEVLDPSTFRIAIHKEKGVEKDSSDRRSSRFSFETQTKYASHSFPDSTNPGLIVVQGENSSNFLKSEDRDEVCHLLSDPRSSQALPESSVGRSGEILPTSASIPSNHQYRHSISHISLPPIQEKDPFAAKSVADQWNCKAYTSKPKNLRGSQSAMKERPGESTSVFALGTERSYHDQVYRENSVPRIGMNRLLMRKMRSNTTVEELSMFSMHKHLTERKTRVLPPLQDRINSALHSEDISPRADGADDIYADEHDLSYINPENDILEILKNSKESEIIALEDMPLSKKTTHILHEVDDEVNFIINSGKCPEALQALDSNAPVTENNHARRFKEMRRSVSQQSVITSKSLKTFEKKLSNIEREHGFMSQKAVGLAERMKKKNHYNKWFVPVEYWNVMKERDFKEKKCEELKKNILFVYNNIHSYQAKDFNPLAGKRVKGVQQLRYEAVQEKLKQNPMIPRIKRALAENNVRVPKFLKGFKTEGMPDV